MNIPGYELLEELFSNASSVTWKARQTALGRVVAVQAPRPEAVKELKTEKFREETRNAAQLTHPGLVHIHDAGESTDGLPYFVLEYVDGPSFHDLQHDHGRLEEKEVLTMIRDVAEALDFAWEKTKSIHMDLTPDNLLRDPTGRTKVLGFGLVRFFGGANMGRDYKYVMGTPNYVAPEQVQGMVDFDPRTDIYSLGAIAVHLFSGIVPFYREKPDEIFEKHLRENLPDLFDRNRNLSPGTYWLVEKMLAKDREHRQANWQEVLADVKAVQKGRLPESKPVEAGQSLLLRSDERPSKPEKTGAKTSGKSNGKGVVTMKSPGENAGKAMAPKTLTYRRKSAAPAVIALLVLVLGAVGLLLTQMKDDVAEDQLAQVPAEGTTPGSFIPLDPKYDPKPATRPELPEVTFPPRKNREPEPLPPPRPMRPEPEPPPQPRYRDFMPATEAELPRNRGVLTTADLDRPRVVRPNRPSGPAPGTRPPPARPPAQPDWDRQGYKDAIGLLANAERAYQNFLRTKNNPKSLKDAEATARDAIELLETIRPNAPANMNLGNTISKANQLIYNIRRSQTL